MSGEKKKFEAIIECRVRKLVYLEDCTAAQARKDPWEYATDEREIDMIDWQVTSLKEDK